MKIWESKPPVTLWATPGLLQDSFTSLVLPEDNPAKPEYEGKCSKFVCPKFILFHAFLYWTVWTYDKFHLFPLKDNVQFLEFILQSYIVNLFYIFLQ